MGLIYDKIKTGMQPSTRAYEWMKFEEIAPIAEARIDYDRYSCIRINKFDRNSNYVEIPLINSDSFQKLSDPTKYIVLVNYLGSRRDSQAIGQVMRRDIYGERTGITKIAEDHTIKM